VATIQDEILEEFCQRLAKTGEFSEIQVKKVRDLFASSKKPKATDLTKVFSDQEPEDKLP
jgi:hypothetical protein